MGSGWVQGSGLRVQGSGLRFTGFGVRRFWTSEVVESRGRCNETGYCG